MQSFDGFIFVVAITQDKFLNNQLRVLLGETP